MGPRKRGEKRRKERNPQKMEETEDSAELGDPSEESTEEVGREKKGRTRERKKYIGAHVSIAGKTHGAHF